MDKHFNDIRAFAGTDTYKRFVDLLELRVQYNREKMDTALIDEVPALQGRIAELKHFLKHLTYKPR
jgi:hypothetical protein